MKNAASTAVRTRFAGWSKPALQFFHGLKRDNSKAYFEAHRQVYEEQVREPMEALLTEIERDLGPDIDVKVFRLNRDLRFTPDKRPYKEHLGAYLSTAGAGGLYLQISPTTASTSPSARTRWRPISSTAIAMRSRERRAKSWLGSSAPSSRRATR